MAHDWARRYVARNRLEPGMRERRSCAGENVGVLSGRSVSTGYASSAGALARFAASTVALIKADMIPG